MVKMDSTPEKTLITMYYTRQSDNLEFLVAILDIFHVPTQGPHVPAQAPHVPAQAPSVTAFFVSMSPLETLLLTKYVL